MAKVFWGKLKESIFSILPIALVVIALTLIFVPNSGWSIFCFSICSLFLIFGICLFNIGIETSLLKMGGYIGSHLSKTKKIFFMLLCSFFIGAIMTMAEPDLLVLANQVPWLNRWTFLIIIGVSVGICLMIAILRIILKVKLQYILAFFYGIILILMFFVPKAFLPLAFDASGVTTGPISVPFIMSFGLGISAVRAGESNKDDGFGLVALCSIGPIIALMIWGIIFGKNIDMSIGITSYETISSASAAGRLIGLELISSIKEVLIVLAPIIIFFLIYQIIALKFPWKNLLRLGIGLLFAYVGIVLFFTGVNAGYLQLANILAVNITSNNTMLLIPICLIFGLFIAVAEPAVHVLNRQVEDVSSGAIKKKSMLLSLSISLSLAIVLSVVRIIFEINIIYFYFPLLLCCIVLSFFVPRQISSIAFDSGGVASGALSSSFVLPFMQGVCLTLGRDSLIYGFGTIGLIIMMPILVVQIMGLKILLNNKKLQKYHKGLDIKEGEISIIEFD